MKILGCIPNQATTLSAPVKYKMSVPSVRLKSYLQGENTKQNSYQSDKFQHIRNQPTVKITAMRIPAFLKIKQSIIDVTVFSSPHKMIHMLLFCFTLFTMQEYTRVYI